MERVADVVSLIISLLVTEYRHTYLQMLIICIMTVAIGLFD